MPFIIDGTNLLRSVEGSGSSAEPFTDVRLCFIISRYLGRIGQKGQIVFDGTGPVEKNSFDSMRDLEVCFSGLGVEADAVIEDKIRANTAPRTLTVVSSDRRLRNAARARSAVSVKSDVFWNQLQKQLSCKGNICREPNSKQSGLTQGETEQWLKFFDLGE